MVKINPTCVARSYASSRTSHVRIGVVLCSTVLKSVLGRNPGLPGPQTAIQTRPGMLLGATLGPKMAALPAEKHMANHRHVDGHAFSEIRHSTTC